MAETEQQQRPHLRVLRGGRDSTANDLEIDVRNARRDLGRLLRAMQAAGHAVTRWGMDAVTRLAHFDSVTARFLLDDGGDEAQVRVALEGLRAVERWIEDGLPRADRAEVRTMELLVRIDDAELHAPLLRPHHAPEEHSPDMHDRPLQTLRSLRAGLRSLDDAALKDLGRRLGLHALHDDSAGTEDARDELTEAIVDTLRDDHLLSILLATLDTDVQKILMGLMHGSLSSDELDELARPAPLALVIGGAPMRPWTSLEVLRGCGLVYGSGRGLWVPVELQPRIDGVLRGLGL